MAKPHATPGIQPNGTEPMVHLDRMAATVFRHAMVATVDRQAAAIGQLRQQLQATRECLADVSLRVDDLAQLLQTLKTAKAWDAAEAPLSRRDDDAGVVAPHQPKIGWSRPKSNRSDDDACVEAPPRKE